jgi:hypothetical protein
MTAKPHEAVLEYTVGILFPWDPARRLFSGERIYVDLASVLGP